MCTRSACWNILNFFLFTISLSCWLYFTSTSSSLAAFYRWANDKLCALSTENNRFHRFGSESMHMVLMNQPHRRNYEQMRRLIIYRSEYHRLNTNFMDFHLVYCSIIVHEALRAHSVSNENQIHWLIIICLNDDEFVSCGFCVFVIEGKLYRC